MVGLTSVDDTADTAKPVSTVQQTALNLKANLASPTFTGTVSGVTKSMVGLANAENTTDLLKVISTATQTALDGKAGTAVATTSVNGLMAATDKTKLDGVATGATANVVNNTLTSISTTEALSAAQGKTLQDAKQATLVSGTTIKTLNSTSLLGAGDIAITQTITNTTAPILTGSAVLSVLTVLATTDWDKQIPVDATTGNITIQLPTAVGNSGKSIRIVRLDSSINTVTVYARYDEGIGGIQTGADAIGIKATGSITIKSNGVQPILAAWENPASVSRLWLPNDLAGQVGWYRPDGLSAGSMATWTDAFGFNNITATGTAPTVATGGQNGYAKIGFNGASNMLSVGSVNLDTLTIMGIFTPVAAAYHNILRGNNSNGFSLGSNNNNPMTLVMGQRGVVNFTASTATWAIGSPALFGATYDAAGVYTYYKDGANGGTATDNRLMATQPMDIASNTNMDYYEQIIYTTVQVAADIDRLSGYLAHKYSLTANLAGGHTYKTLPPLVSLATY